jgi:hypothetical protein
LGTLKSLKSLTLNLCLWAALGGGAMGDPGDPASLDSSVLAGDVTPHRLFLSTVGAGQTTPAAAVGRLPATTASSARRPLLVLARPYRYPGNEMRAAPGGVTPRGVQKRVAAIPSSTRSPVARHRLMQASAVSQLRSRRENATVAMLPAQRPAWRPPAKRRGDAPVSTSSPASRALSQVARLSAGDLLGALSSIREDALSGRQLAARPTTTRMSRTKQEIIQMRPGKTEPAAAGKTAPS